MGLSLRNIGSRIFDQINPFDAGLSATTRKVDPLKAQQSVATQVRDIFDANTQADQQKRLRATLPVGHGVRRGPAPVDESVRFYKDQQQQLRRDNVQSVAENPFRRIFEEVTEAPRRVGIGLARGTSQQDRVNRALLVSRRLYRTSD